MHMDMGCGGYGLAFIQSPTVQPFLTASWERKDLGDESVQVGISRPLDVQIPAANVVDGFIVVHHGHFGVFQEGVARQDAVVRLHRCTGDLWARENAHTVDSLDFLP
jgi:hypothetical protein